MTIILSIQLSTVGRHLRGKGGGGTEGGEARKMGVDAWKLGVEWRLLDEETERKDSQRVYYKNIRLST